MLNAKSSQSASSSGVAARQSSLAFVHVRRPATKAASMRTKVKNVYIDPRNGEEVVQLTTKSVGPKP